MKKLLIGFVAGLFFGAASASVAAVMAGDAGYLFGWSIVNANGEEICSNPFVWTATNEIECD
jgi:hypothetical protein